LSLTDLRPRTPLTLPLLAAAERRNTAAHGALGRITAGSGVAVFARLELAALDADTKTYLRFTRTLAQLAADLNGAFVHDPELFNFKPARGQPIVVCGEWTYQVEAMLPKASKPGDVADPSNAALTAGGQKPDFDDSA